MSMPFRLAWLFVALALSADGDGVPWRDFIGLQLLGALGWGHLFPWPKDRAESEATPQETER
jgi:hypothetical protein